MARADSAALQKLLPLLRQLRELRGLRETAPGVFQLKGGAFISIDDESGALVAQMKKTGGSGFDRYPVDTPTGQRKLVDDAKRRVVRSDDD